MFKKILGGLVLLGGGIAGYNYLGRRKKKDENKKLEQKLSTATGTQATVKDPSQVEQEIDVDEQPQDGEAQQEEQSSNFIQFLDEFTGPTQTLAPIGGTRESAITDAKSLVENIPQTDVPKGVIPSALTEKAPGTMVPIVVMPNMETVSNSDQMRFVLIETGERIVPKIGVLKNYSSILIERNLSLQVNIQMITGIATKSAIGYIEALQGYYRDVHGIEMLIVR